MLSEQVPLPRFRHDSDESNKVGTPRLPNPGVCHERQRALVPDRRRDLRA